MPSVLYFSVSVCFVFSFYLLVCCSGVTQVYSSGTEIASCICNQLWYWESILNVELSIVFVLKLEFHNYREDKIQTKPHTKAVIGH